MVHRDIKPENVLLHEGHAIIADFGIGKAIADAQSTDATITKLGVIVGTPAYMALREARTSLTLVLAQGTDRRGGTYVAMLDLAASVAMYAGDHAAALDWLEEQRSLPLHWSPSYLRVNPYYAPLRGNPRFERLTAEAS